MAGENNSIEAIYSKRVDTSKLYEKYSQRTAPVEHKKMPNSIFVNNAVNNASYMS